MSISRIWVTGNAGSGKTTLVSALSCAFALPAHSLDSIVWQPGWKKTPDDLKQALIAELAAGDAWVVDGVSVSAMKAADVVVFLDLPRRVTAWRAMRRNVRYVFRSRPGLPPRCPEIRVAPRLVKIIWRFPTHTRPRILDAIEACADRQLVVHITTTHAQRQLAAQLGAARNPDAAYAVLRSFAARSGVTAALSDALPEAAF